MNAVSVHGIFPEIEMTQPATLRGRDINEIDTQDHFLTRISMDITEKPRGQKRKASESVAGETPERRKITRACDSCKEYIHYP
jgi:hypothetical protein